MLPGMVRSLRDRLDDLEANATERGQKGLVLVVRGVNLTLEVGRQLIGDQALRTAAALAFTTIVSMVPLLAVSFSVMKAFVPNEELAQRVRGWLLGTLLADSVGEVSGILESFLERAQGGAIGLVGFTFLMVTALSLFLSIERAFNRIWRVPTSRPLHRRLVTFYAVITLAPALVGLGFGVARWMQAGLDAMPFGFTVGAQFITFALSVLALLLTYRLLPHTTVHWRVALLGAVWAAVMIQLSKWAFNLYIESIYAGSVQSKIYGSFALVPVFFLWVYLTWIIVLGGVEVAYMVQNRTALTRALLHRRRRPGDAAAAPPTGYLLTRVFLDIARRFRAAGGGTATEEIAASLQIELDEVELGLRLLREGGLLLMVDGGEAAGRLIPARPLDRVTLHDLHELCDGLGYQPGELPLAGAEKLEEHLIALRATRAKGLERTVLSLLDEPSPSTAAVRKPRGTLEPGSAPPASAPPGIAPPAKAASEGDRQPDTDPDSPTRRSSRTAS